MYNLKTFDIYLYHNYNIIIERYSKSEVTRSTMEHFKFEWDENKNAINKNKHNIASEEAQTVFYDEMALVIDDPDHSEQEDRFIILGQSSQAKLLVVCHCYRESDTVIRIISARKATKTESSQYYDI